MSFQEKYAVKLGVSPDGSPRLFGKYTDKELAEADIPSLQQGYEVDGMSVVPIPQESADSEKSPAS